MMRIPWMREGEGGRRPGAVPSAPAAAEGAWASPGWPVRWVAYVLCISLVAVGCARPVAGVRILGPRWQATVTTAPWPPRGILPHHVVVTVDGRSPLPPTATLRAAMPGMGHGPATAVLRLTRPGRYEADVWRRDELMRTRVARHVAWVVALGVVVLAATAAGAAAPYKVHITLKEFAFVPKTITVPAGPVQLSATNAGTVEHTLVIPALKVKSPPIEPGQTWTVTLTIPKGTYQGYCDVPGHKELGMVLTVVAR